MKGRIVSITLFTLIAFLLVVAAGYAYRVVSPDDLLGAKAIKDGLVPMQKKVDRIAPDPLRADQDFPKTFRGGCVAWGSKVTLPECSYADRDSEKKVVLFGDSRPMMYFSALEKISLERGWNLVNLIRVNCPPALVAIEDRYCNRWRRNTLRRIVTRERPDIVILGSATKASYRAIINGKLLTRERSQSHLVRGMVRTINTIKQAGAMPIVIRDQALAPFKPSDCVAKNPDNLSRCAFRPKSRKARAFELQASKKTGSRVIDPQRMFCSKRRCPAVIGDMAVHFDSYHVTSTYAKTLDEWFARRIPSITK